jgi:hypothetical protein
MIFNKLFALYKANVLLTNFVTGHLFLSLYYDIVIEKILFYFCMGFLYMKMMGNSLKAASYAAIFKCASFLKVSFLFGSSCIWFSGINMVLPLSGAFGGVFGAGLVFLVRQLLHIMFFKTISLSFLALCIPGFCASLYWSTRSFFVHVLLPLTCVILFIIHPIGSQAFVYSFYWLIPAVFYFIPRKSLFLTALGSTFIAHAVGSVIWCYTAFSTPAMWMGLIPVVAFERTAFALGMVVAHQLFSFIFTMIDTGVIGSKNPAIHPSGVRG